MAGRPAGQGRPGLRRGGPGTGHVVADASQLGEGGGVTFRHKGAGVKPVTPEQMELSRLRAENKRLQMELEVEKKRRRVQLVIATPSGLMSPQEVR